VTQPPSAWRRHLGTLAIVAFLLLALFATDVGQLVHIWWTSTTFGHCLFITPVVGWLVWQRRTELAQVEPVAWWPGLALVAIGAAGWLMGAAAGVAFARQLGLVVMLQGATVAILGPNVARGLLFPLGYALFLVPFGEELEPPLQAITVAEVVPLLHLAGIPATVDGVLIHAGRYYFEVAEACSGSKFVIAMMAFAVLVAGLCFAGWRRRLVFLVVAMVVPVLANGVRAFATIWAADRWGVEAATGFDHIVFGWIFFGMVMAAVLAIGWRWFDRAPDDPAFDPARFQHRPRASMPLALGALATLALPVVAAGWNGAIAARVTPLPSRMELPVVPGWTRVPLDEAAAWQPYYPSADHYLVGRYARGGDAVDVAIAAFAGQREGHKLLAAGAGVVHEGDRWLRVAALPAIAGGETMRIVAPGPVERVVASWYRVGGTTTADGKRVKLLTMTARLTGGDQAAVALHLSARGRDGAAAIERFLAAAGPPDRIAAAAIGRR
jgi:exosortase A